MNRKDGNGWILCPSKTFPGKLYYFNVINGEAAWCINEEEKQAFNNEPCQRVSDRQHSYPEPNTPPSVYSLDDPNVCYNFNPPSNIPFNYHMPAPTHAYGQPVVPKFIPNTYMPGYMLPMGQMVQNAPRKHEMRKRLFDQVTQTIEDCDVHVQTCTIPLSKRFAGYGQVAMGSKAFEDKDTYNKVICWNSGGKQSQGNVSEPQTSKNTFSIPQGRVFGPKLDSHNIVKQTAIKITPCSSKFNQPQSTVMDSMLNIQSTQQVKSKFLEQNSLNTEKNVVKTAKKPVLIWRRFVNKNNLQILVTENDQNTTTTQNAEHNISMSKENCVQNIKTEKNRIKSFEKCTLEPLHIAGNLTVSTNNAENSERALDKSEAGRLTVSTNNAERALNKSESGRLTVSTNNAERALNKSQAGRLTVSTNNAGNSERALDKSDLRFVLESRKRNAAMTTANTTGQVKVKQLKANTVNTGLSSKKRVTFDLQSPREVHFTTANSEIESPNELKVDLAPETQSFHTDQASEAQNYQIDPARETQNFQIDPAPETQSFHIDQASDAQNYQIDPARETQNFQIDPAPETQCFHTDPDPETGSFHIDHSFPFHPVPETQCFQIDPAPTLSIAYLKSLANPSLKTDPWYVVMDTDVILEGLKFIEDYVKKDITCRLMVPNAVRVSIEAACVGGSCGRERVVRARTALRRLAALADHVVLQPPIMEKPSPSINDGIIDCCLQTLEFHHTVLITTDPELYNAGVSSSIHTYKLDDIQTSLANQPEISFGMEKIDSSDENENIFMRNPESFKSFYLNNDEGNNDSFDFKVPTSMKNRKDNWNKRTDLNKHTNDKLLDITRVRQALNKIHSSNVPKNLNLEKNSKPSIFDDSEENVSTKRKEFKNYSNLNLKRVIDNTNKPRDNNYKNNCVTRFETERQRIFGTAVQTSNNEQNEHRVSSTSELRIARPQTMNMSNREQNDRNSSKINSYSMDDMLKPFEVKDATMNLRIKTRLNEWVCCFLQIMEDCLTHVLMNNSKITENALTAPWTLLEALLCVKRVYSNSPVVRTIAEKFCSVLSTLNDRDDVLNKLIEPTSFMKLFGCGVLLVESLKRVSNCLEQVIESEKLLNNLFTLIKDPTRDLEIEMNSPVRANQCEYDELVGANKPIAPKKPSEILEYLKKHFEAWRGFEGNLSPSEDKTKKEKTAEATVVRTLGKRLNTIKLNRTRHISCNTTANKKTEVKDNVEITQIQHNTAKCTKTVENVQKKEDNINDKINISVDQNKNNVSKISPNKDVTKIIRKVNIIGDFEEKLQKNKLAKYFDEDLNDYQMFENEFNDNYDQSYNDFATNLKFGAHQTAILLEVEDITSEKSILKRDTGRKLDKNVSQKNYDKVEQRFNVESVNVNDKQAQGHDNEVKDSDKTVQDNDKISYKDDSTNDSGIENESLQTCAFIRKFLSQLCSTLIIVYNFINDSIHELSWNIVDSGDRNHLFEKANQYHLHVANIISRLESIIERESGESTPLKNLIINAGIDAQNDKRISRYRQVVTKCLEQAQVLEKALKSMVSTNVSGEETSERDRKCDIRYFNIFE